MKLLKFILPIVLIMAAFFSTESCNRKTGQNNQVELDANCRLKPKPGPCKGAFTMYYYHPEEKKCKTFIWGGCEGVVPFKTLEDCQKGCGCD